jgi:hypothetical protein
MLPRIDLTYGLDPEARLYNGRYAITVGNETNEDLFYERTFSQMMSRLAKYVREFEGKCEVFLHRTEVEGSRYKLDDELIQLLNVDPPRAIGAMHVPDRTLYVRDSAKPQATATVKLRAGHDTLADAFGDEVYCRLRKYDVEDPVTGRWHGLCRSVSRQDEDPEPYSLIYEREGERLELFGYAVGERWFRIRTEDLIGLDHADRFYLPRLWNKSGSWISRDELLQMYAAYQKEKEECSQDKEEAE